MTTVESGFRAYSPPKDSYETLQSRFLSAKAMEQSATALDETIHSLHTSFPPQANDQQFAADVARLRELEVTIDTMTHPDVEPMDQTLYYGLLARRALAATSVLAPTLFTHENAPAIVDEAINGTAGLTSALLDKALERYDSSRTGYVRDHLAGAIGELTFLTQANLDENGTNLAVPAPLHDDWFRRTDAHIYHREARTDAPYRANVQVKSGWLSKGFAPKNGFKITGSDMQNPRSEDFPISRAVSALHATGRLTPQESSQLDAAHTHLWTVLKRKLAARPGVSLQDDKSVI